MELKIRQLIGYAFIAMIFAIGVLCVYLEYTDGMEKADITIVPLISNVYTEYYIMSYEDFVLEFGMVPGYNKNCGTDFDNPILATTLIHTITPINDTVFYTDIMIGAPTPYKGTMWLQDCTVCLWSNVSGIFTVTTERLSGADIKVEEVSGITPYSGRCYLIGDIQSNHRKVQVGRSAMYRFTFTTDEAYNIIPKVDVIYSFTLMN